MDGAIRGVTDRALVQPPRRDRRARDEGEAFKQELEHAGDDESLDVELNDTVVVPRPRRAERPVGHATEDEAGYRVEILEAVGGG